MWGYLSVGVQVMARPSKYDSKFHPQVCKWMARNGLTDKQICEELEIAESTFNNWKIKYPELMESLKENKEFPDSLVEDSLYKRAMGFSYVENHMTVDDKGGITTKDISKMVVPDVTAQIFWLKNRQPDKWRDTKHIDDLTDRSEFLKEVREISEKFIKEQNEK